MNKSIKILLFVILIVLAILALIVNYYISNSFITTPGYSIYCGEIKYSIIDNVIADNANNSSCQFSISVIDKAGYMKEYVSNDPSLVGAQKIKLKNELILDPACKYNFLPYNSQGIFIDDQDNLLKCTTVFYE